VSWAQCSERVSRAQPVTTGLFAAREVLDVELLVAVGPYRKIAMTNGLEPHAPPTREEAVAFLGRDFDQAFSEKRRLEDQIWDVCKFAFTVQGTMIGLAVGVYRYSLGADTNLVPAALVLLAISLAVGAFLIQLMVRTRIYFVVVSRYINAQRLYFSTAEAPGTASLSWYYHDPAQPTYFSWNSTQIWATFLVSFFNAAVAGTLLFLLAHPGANRDILSVVALVLTFLVQVIGVLRFLRSKEGRSAAVAVCG